MIAPTFIGPEPPKDGRQWDCQCARCGSSMDSESCGACDGEGQTSPGDPLWYDEDATEPCHQCGGEGAWMLCISTPEWCQAHPLKGREETERHTPEWFVVSPP